MVWSDLFALLFTLIVLCGVIYLIVSTNKAMDNVIQNAKKNLKSRGLDVSSKGIAVKTDKQFDRESYMEATQRGLMNALNASSVQHHEHGVQRSTSAHASHTALDVVNGDKHAASFLRRSHSNQGEEKKHRTHFWKGRQKDSL